MQAGIYGEYRYSFTHSQPRHQMEASVHLEIQTTSAPGKESLVTTEQEAGLASQPVWTFCRRGESVAPAVNWTLDHPAYSLVTTLTELSQLPNLFCRVLSVMLLHFLARYFVMIEMKTNSRLVFVFCREEDEGSQRVRAGEGMSTLPRNTAHFETVCIFNYYR